MSEISKIKKSLSEGISTAFEDGSKIVERTDGAEKLAKLIDSIINLMQLTLTGSFLTPFGNLRGRLQAFTDVVAALGIFNRGKDWCSIDDTLKGTKDEGKRMWQSSKLTACKIKLFNHVATIKFKIWNRAFMTVASVIETARFLDRTQIIRLGVIGSFAIGRLPVLGLAKDICVLGFSGFSIAENAVKLESSREEYALAKAKLQMWRNAADTFNTDQQKSGTRASLGPFSAAFEAVNTHVQRILNIRGADAMSPRVSNWVSSHKYSGEELKKYIEEKRNKILIKLDARRKQFNESVKEARNELETPKTEQNQNTIILKKKELKYLSQELDLINDDIRAIEAGKSDDLVFYKRARALVKKENLEYKRNKSVLTIAGDVGKIALVTLGLIGLVTGASAALPFSIGIGILAAAVNSIGFYRFFYDDRKELVPLRPVGAYRIQRMELSNV